MEYRKIIDLSDNISNQPSKFKTKNWVKINDESQGTYDKVNQIKFKTSMLRSSLCYYSDAYILAKGTITAINASAQHQSNKGANRKAIYKNWAPFTKCICRINNTHIDDAHDIVVVMSAIFEKMYQVNEMIIQLVVCWTIIISKTIIR